MEHPLSIPREALAELLKAAGSPLTPEEYLASLPEVNTFSRYRGRARAAFWSKYIMLFFAGGSTLLLPVIIWYSLGTSVASMLSILEAILVVAGLIGVTFFEFKVHRYFVERDPRAPDLGFRNQTYFAAAILVYCLYHAAVFPVVTLPAEYQEYIVSDPPNPIDPAAIRHLAQMLFLVVGVVGALSQFGLAWYYRSAKSLPSA